MSDQLIIDENELPIAATEPNPSWNREDMDEFERSHEQLLQSLAVMCRSDKDSFTVTDRLEAIERELASTPYMEYSLPHARIWCKVPLESLPKNVLLISSHVDTVPDITECSSVLRDTGLYSGTYDNQGTNAAAVALMKEYDLPESVVFAFTGEEETGRCFGARSCAKYFTQTGHSLRAIALDVTYEGFDEDDLWTLENLSKGSEGRQFLDEAFAAALATEPDGERTFKFVKIGKKHVPSNLPEEYKNDSQGMYDEGMAYRDEDVPAFSACLPCDGEMHSNSGVVVKQPVFEGYVVSLASMVYGMTRTHPALVESLKIQKSTLKARAEQIHYERPVIQYTGMFRTHEPAYNSEARFGYLSDYGYDDDDYEGPTWYADADEQMEIYDEVITEIEYLCSPYKASILEAAASYDDEDEFVSETDLGEIFQTELSDLASTFGITREEVAMCLEDYCYMVFREAHESDYEEEEEFT